MPSQLLSETGVNSSEPMPSQLLSETGVILRMKQNQ
jgi:hypothetical protein